MPILTITPQGDMDIDGTPCASYLSRSERKILLAIGRRKGVATKEHLLQDGWSDAISEDEVPEIKIIDVFVCKIRKKIGPEFGHAVVETVWGEGYKIGEGWKIVRPEENAAYSVSVDEETMNKLYEAAHALDRDPEELAVDLFKHAVRSALDDAWWL